jgi:hypothetical protein
MMRVLHLVGFAGTPEKNAQTIIRLACADEVAGTTGRFFSRGRERKTNAITYDAAVATRLWHVSDALSARDAAGPNASVIPLLVASAAVTK